MKHGTLMLVVCIWLLSGLAVANTKDVDVVLLIFPDIWDKMRIPKPPFNLATAVAFIRIRMTPKGRSLKSTERCCNARGITTWWALMP